MENSEYVIDVHGLNKHFGDKHVVRDISMQVARGEIFGFLGPNGSGKTTSIRMMCGLLTPDSGEGRCLGYNIRTENEAIKKRVGYMTQRFSMWEDLTIRENLDFIARMYEMPGRKQIVKTSLEQLGLAERADQLAGSLSGGWKQRLALAACMLHKPELLLLDEPTAGVDPKARKDFWDELHQLAAEGISVLVTTHYMDEAERCNKLVYIDKGKVLAQGTALEIIEGEHLNTVSISGGDLTALARDLEEKPGIEQVITFGAELHASGKDQAAFEKALKSIGEEHHIKKIPTSLEDVFIHLMNRDTKEKNP